jgi:prevent-host-death family protein
MKPNISEDIIPVSEFKKNTASYLKDIQTKGRAVILTQNGHSAAVVLSPKAFEKMQYEHALFSSVLAGEKEIEKGLGISHQRVFGELSKILKRPL